MKIINRKNFIFVVCLIFTFTTLLKVIYEALFMGVYGHYPLNIMNIFLLSLFATLILSLHRRLYNFPLLVAVLIQYILIILSMAFIVWVDGFFMELAVNAYKDMFVSTTFIYALVSAIYYVYFYINLKKHNSMIQKIREKKNKK